MTKTDVCKAIFGCLFITIFCELGFCGNETSQKLPLQEWSGLIGSSETLTSAEGLYNQGFLQEAIWQLEDAKLHEAANKLKYYLRFILEHGAILNMTDLGLGGTTTTKRIFLPHGISAVFKPKSFHPSANYRSEIAAYLIDQAGKFRLVPMTVRRKINGQTGALQYFVKKSKTIHAVANKYRKSANLNVFDYIIDNKDRNEGNILLKDGREIAIDHGLSLRFINPIGEVLKVYDHLSWGLGANRHPVRQRWLHPKKDIHEFWLIKS